MGDSEAARDAEVAGGGDLVDGFFAMAMIDAGAAGVPASPSPRRSVRVARRTPAGPRWCSRPATLATRVAAGPGRGHRRSARRWCWSPPASGWASGTRWSPATATRSLRLTLADPGLAAGGAGAGGLTRLLYGIAPRFATLGWLGLGYAVVVLMFGRDAAAARLGARALPVRAPRPGTGRVVRPGAFAAVAGAATLLSLGGWFALTRRDVG